MAAVPEPRGAPPASRLARRLGTGDAVILGLGAMIGAGVFSAFAPAARAAGGGLLIALGVAAVVAYANASSSAALAALYPTSGGTYVYGRARLGPLWGFAAGFGFVVGKSASCSAMALTFGSYVWPAHGRPLALAAVIGLVLVNLAGIRKTALATKAIVVVVLACLAFVVAAALAGGSPSASRLTPLGGHGAYGILQASGILFFAFAGYARIATLGEEVREPERTIPRAIPIALAVTLAVYAAVGISALLVLGAPQLGHSGAPLRAVVAAGSWHRAGSVVRVGAAVASLGALLSLLAGTSRTVFAMAANRDLPHGLSAVHSERRTPFVAELVLGAAVVALTAFVDIRGAIGFSSFAVLGYYAIANTSALTLTRAERRMPRAVALIGLAGCLVLAATLPWRSAAAGAVLLAAGVATYGINQGRQSRGR
jgi:basic amino acid/polyamine antiporter, APA family